MPVGKTSIHRGQLVGLRLKAAREKKGLSPQDVAERFGVCDQTVLNWETGRAIPKPERLSALAKLYGLSMKWLIERASADKESFQHQYVIIRSDGKTDDPETRYFILKVNSDPHARKALRVYQESVRRTDPKLAEDISAWLKESE